MAVLTTQVDYARKEKIIVIYLITSTSFCIKLFEQFQDIQQYFQTVYAKKISGWCEDYFLKYHKSPKVAIQEIFNVEREKMEDRTIASIEEFLHSASEEFEREEKKMNTSYVFDLAKDYFRLVNLIKLRNILNNQILKNDIDEGEIAVSLFTSYEGKKKEQEWKDPFDKKTVRAMFAKKEEDTLMVFPGDLGQAIGRLERGQLVAIRGRSGVGKTFWMIEFALHGCTQGYNVIFASLELTERQLVERLYSYLTGDVISRDVESEQNYVKEVSIPLLDCRHNQSGKCEKECRISSTKIEMKGSTDCPPGYKVCTVCRGTNDFNPITWHKKTRKNVVSEKGLLQRYADLMETRMFPGKLRMMTYPSGKITVERFETDIGFLERTGFVPDVIVTDYADKFQMSSRDNPVQQIAHIWEVHKALALDKHVLVVTGSQINKQGEWKGAMAKEELIDIGIHLEQSDGEKKSGIMNVSLEKHRSRAFLKSSKVQVIHSFEIGRPYLDSYVLTHPIEPEKTSKKK